jgi:hypothetical protein
MNDESFSRKPFYICSLDLANMSIVNPLVIRTIKLMLQNIPTMLGESATLKSIRAANTLPGLASFSVPDCERNISLVKFHRDLAFESFPEFEVQYRAQYTKFTGRFLMIFDLQWVDWSTMSEETMLAFLNMVDSLKLYRASHVLGVCILLPQEYEQLAFFFQQLMNDLSTDTDRLITSSFASVEEYVDKMFRQ